MRIRESQANQTDTDIEREQVASALELATESEGLVNITSKNGGNCKLSPQILFLLMPEVSSSTIAGSRAHAFDDLASFLYMSMGGCSPSITN